MLLNVTVSPGARNSELVGRHGDGIKVRIHAVPEGGQANRELERWLAGVLGAPRTAIAVVRGHTSRQKVVEVRDLELVQVLERLGL